MNRFDTPPEPSKNPIARDLPLVTPEIAASREALDAIVIPGHMHGAPDYRVLPQDTEPRQKQIERLGAEVAQQVIARHTTPVLRDPTF